jgi:hypothetical protein
VTEVVHIKTFLKFGKTFEIPVLSHISFLLPNIKSKSTIFIEISDDSAFSPSSLLRRIPVQAMFNKSADAHGFIKITVKHSNISHYLTGVHLSSTNCSLGISTYSIL